MPMTNTNYVITPEQTGMVIDFKNRENIADQVMPIKKLLSKSSSFKYAERNLADGFTVPESMIGRASVPNQITTNVDGKGGVCVDYALTRFIPQQDIDESEGQVGNLTTDALAEIMDNVLLNREKRVAAIVQNKNNYLTNHVVTVGADDKFSSDKSDPLEYLLAMLDKAIVRPNRMIIGQRAWTQLRLHPVIVQAMHRNAGPSGVATRQVVAELLEINEVIVGRSLINANKKGEQLKLEPCWGDNVAFHYYEEIANTSRGLAWGMTFQSGDRVATTTWTDHLGLKGGYEVKAGASWAETVTAPGAGMLLIGVV